MSAPSRTEAPCLIAGAGFSGAVTARVLAEAGFAVELYEARPQIAGNCYTARCPDTGVIEHIYGPHLFHTSDPEVRDYVTRFATFRSYQHRVKTTHRGEVFSLPVNLHSINQLFRKSFSPDEARAFVAARCCAPAHGGPPANFEEQALATIGPELYAAFFQGYTRKQWGCDPRELPASVLTRLPLRFSYDDSYFNHSFQGQPEEGYTPLIAAILDHPRIQLHLNAPLTPSLARDGLASGRWQHLIWTGPLDLWFGHSAGRLGYRSLRFEREIHATPDFQGCAVMNYPDEGTPFTRITEHKHFAPWEAPRPHTLISREYSFLCGPDDIPFYPLRQNTSDSLIRHYTKAARAEPHVSFLGRLGTWRYLDMDVSIREALDLGRALATALRQGHAPPVFGKAPI